MNSWGLIFFFVLQDETHAEKVTKSIELESQLGQLQTSLFDIAQVNNLW